ncbi:hypothetical protein LNK15_10905 [Jeotgalicoccus huakuii]|jgi:hypothetical protein|uniref:hypothetical protein n=1 Tax=Jeotgalicoccus TaxID=227979 RepID=UPI00040DB58A|nr:MULTISPECIES: hypothetical protein [Jeotgalicoccus]MCK1977566.1 hypothetical protein [Jeotgalicoccus huakuii]QQD84103.1 hypothetical protein JEM45_05395 [Jeotgalicoccus sp. ATCC 8456]
MKKSLPGMTSLRLLRDLMDKRKQKKNGAYSEEVDQEKLDRNIQVAKERLEDRDLTMCQRQEYEKTLEHLVRQKK